jgi:putative membrane protein
MVLLAVLCCASEAYAHGGAADEGGPWWTRWNFDPLILFNITALSVLYVAGLRRIWGRAGRGRGASRLQAASFAGAMLAVIIALISPLDPLSDELSYMHMIQHMTLMMIAAPLFILSSPALVMLWALPRGARHWAARLQGRLSAWRPGRYLLWQPLTLWLLYAFTLWVWHLPGLYGAALRYAWVHELQHVCFFVAAALFWRVLIDPITRLSLNRAAGVLYLFTTSLHATVLGVFMALAPRPWYPEYLGRTAAFNLTALEDQQLAGFIMWMPACAIYAIVAAAIFALLARGDAEDVQGRQEAAAEGGI